MKNYVIIGGSSGIGKAIVETLEKQGENVIATYNNNPATDSAQVKYHKLEVTSESLDVEGFPEEIHGIAYCPGSINLKPFHRLKEEDYISDFQLQVIGATKIIKQLLPRLKKASQASIVLFSSVAVQSGFTFHTQVSISKGAIEGLTRALAAELSPSIRVNAIAPALTDTGLAGKLLSTPEKVKYHADKNPLKRVGSPQDIAKAAVFLLGDKSSWVTGQIMKVDGGFGNLR